MAKDKKSLLVAAFLLAACGNHAADMPAPETPAAWAMERDGFFKKTGAEKLHEWWRGFDDQTLNNLVSYALAGNPDRRVAEARVLEARGLRRSARAALFPQIGVSASGGREDTGEDTADSQGGLYDARFDASWELDIFGRNRAAAKAEGDKVEAAEAGYRGVTLTLIAEVARAYLDYRVAQYRVRIAEKNLHIQEKTLSMVQDRFRSGDAPKLDVARAASLAETTRASIPEFKRQEEDILLRLRVLTGLPHDAIVSALPPQKNADVVPGTDIAPVLLAPAQVLALRPDVHQAALNLAANSALAESAAAEVFPSLTLSGFYGIGKSIGLTPGALWNVTLGAAMSLLDFGRIEGRIDAAHAREKQAYELYRKSVIGAVAEVETALTDYSRLHERNVALRKAYDDASTAWTEAQLLFGSGLISFLDVLDSQRNLNDAETALVISQSDQSASLIRLYKALGVY